MALGWGLAVAATLACYVLWPLLVPRGPAPARALDRRLGALLYAVAYLLSLLRAPLGLAPYLLKMILILALRVRYEAAHSTYRREVVNMAGDALNLAGTALFLFIT